MPQITKTIVPCAATYSITCAPTPHKKALGDPLHNKVDFTLPPEDLFLNPGSDPGFYPLRAPDYFWRARPRARILGFSASQHPEITAKIDNFVTYTNRHKLFSKAVEFNTIPVLLENARFKKSFVTAAGRGLLSGAAGMRLQNRYLWANEDQPFDAEARLTAYFDQSQSRNTETLFHAYRDAPADLPFAVDCRNTFNYYHFLTESLCQLCSLDDIGSNRPIFMHFPNQEEKTRSFTKAFVDALFPELQGRVVFERAPKSYDQVLCAYNLLNSYYHYPNSLVPPVDPLIASPTLWKGKQASRASQGVLAMNSVDRNLFRLRERGLRAIEGQDFSHLPRRFWVAREASHARARVMDGEEELLDMLQLFGFQKVAFESLTPLEQIAIMANAEVMMSYHGAGFANMLFANPKAHVLELGTLQTAMFRWGDFWRLANVSGCNYVSFFADFAKDDPLIEPNFAEEGIAPVSLSRHGLAVVMSFLVSLIGHMPVYSHPRDVRRVAQQLNQIGAPERTWELFQNHPGIEEGDAALCLLLAECQRQRGDHRAELAALKLAHSVDPARAYTVMQIIWCAQKLGDRIEVNAALARLRSGFPEKYEDMVRDRPWLRKLV